MRVPSVPGPMTSKKAGVKGAQGGIDVQDAVLRGEQAEERKTGRGWDWDLDLFEPRRWLLRDENGNEVFDGNALPTLVFGGGFRGCFGKLSTNRETSSLKVLLTASTVGKKLAMRELRIIITMIVLSFEFLPLPAEQSSMVAEERLFRKPRVCRVKLRPL